MRSRLPTVFALLSTLALAQVPVATNAASIGAATGRHIVQDAGGGLWCLSVADDGSGNRPLLLSRSLDGGQSWAADPFVFNDAASGITPPNPTTTCCLAIDSSGRLHACWSRYYYPSYFQLFYRNFDPATGASSAILDVTASLGVTTLSRTDALALAVDATDTVWMAAPTAASWVSQLLRSTTPGASTLAFTSVGNMSASASSQAPEIAIDSAGRVHCSFYRNVGAGNYEHRYYDPATLTWDAGSVLGNTAPSNDFYGRICADSLGNVHAVYVADAYAGSTMLFRYKIWNATAGWSPETVLFDATPAQSTNIANYQILAIGCDEATGVAYAAYRDLANGGPLRLSFKGLSDTAFTLIGDLAPPSAVLHAYYVPSIRGSLYPAFNNTGVLVDLSWRAAGPPLSLMFQRTNLGPPPASLTISAPATMGTVTSLDLSAPADANRTYLCVLSLGTVPGIVLPDSRVVPLNWDFLLEFTLVPNNGVLFNNSAVLDGNGAASVIFAVPVVPGAAGITIYAGFLVGNPANPIGIGTISSALPIVIF